MTTLNTLRELRNQNKYETIISLVEKEEIKPDVLNQFIEPELGFIAYNVKMFAHDPDKEALNDIIGNTVKLITSIVINPNTDISTLLLVASNPNLGELAKIAEHKLLA